MQSRLWGLLTSGRGRCVAFALLGLTSCGQTERASGPEGAPASGGLGGTAGSSSTHDGTGDGGVTATSSSGGTAGAGGGGAGGGGGTGGAGAGGEPEPGWTQEAELPEPGTLEGDFATNDVSLHDGTAALSGAANARVFVREGDGWVEQRVFKPDAALDIGFGASVAVFGNTSLVGAPSDGEGSVYVLERTGDTWSEAGRLRPSEDVESSGFGRDLALNDSTALVGTWQGVAYVFSRNAAGEWTDEERLAAGTGDGSDMLTSVAVDGDTALVAAYHGSGGTKAGAYVYVRRDAGWELQQELVPETTDEGAEFGAAVGLSGDIALVGAPYDRDFRGAVHVFSREGAIWRRDPVLLGADGDDGFGGAIAMHGNVALIASFRRRGYYSGSVRVLARSDGSWEMVQELTSPGDPLDHFGSSVSVFEDTALIAAPGDGEFDDWFGSAYVFEHSSDQ